jgi:hypothetical protein
MLETERESADYRGGREGAIDGGKIGSVVFFGEEFFPLVAKGVVIEM